MHNRVIYIFLAVFVIGAGIAGWRYMATLEQAPLAPLSDIATGAAQPQETNGNTAQPITSFLRVSVKTNFGDITLELFPKDAPLTVENFLKLSRQGFYNGTRFHRVIKGFMIQAGDPNSTDADWSDDGMGGPGYTFQDEINEHKIVRGALAMANAGPATNGSQFFIVTAEATPWLDGKHTVFGRVIAGMDTVDKIENVATDKARGDHPIENVTISAIEITEK